MELEPQIDRRAFTHAIPQPISREALLEMEEIVPKFKQSTERQATHREEEEEPIDWSSFSEEGRETMIATCVNVLADESNAWLLPYLKALLDEEERKPEKKKKVTKHPSTIQKARASAISRGYIDITDYLPKNQVPVAKKILIGWNIVSVIGTLKSLQMLDARGVEIVEQVFEKIQMQAQKKAREQRVKTIEKNVRKAVRQIIGEPDSAIARRGSRAIIDAVSSEIAQAINAETENILSPDEIMTCYRELIRTKLSEHEPVDTNSEENSPGFNEFKKKNVAQRNWRKKKN